MSSVDYLRKFVNERLTAAAEEIFGVFQKTIVQYEAEINRQRRLLDVFWKPETRLHGIELPLQHVCEEEEEEDVTDQQLCIQERSLDQEDPDPPQIKEEEEELCTSEEGEQLVLKQETDDFMWTPTYEESDFSGNQTLNFNPDNTLSAAEKESVVNIPVISFVVSDDCSDIQLLSHNSHEAGKSISHSNYVNNHNLSEIHRNTHTGKNYVNCEICGKVFRCNSDLQRHMRVHTGEKPYSCQTCGKDFRRNDELVVHMRTHTGEKPYLCNTCGKRFSCLSSLVPHLRIHTGEKPYSCKTCGKDFSRLGNLKVHMRTHTGEKQPLYSDIRVHTDK